MDNRTNTIETEWVARMLAAVRQRDEPWADYLREAGIAPELVDDPRGRVGAVQCANLFRVLIDRRQDEALGFLSRRLRPGSFAVIARNALGARSLGAAIRRTCAALNLLQDDFELRLDSSTDPCHLTLRFVNAEAGCYTFAHELMMRVYWQWFVWLAGGHLPAARFEFAYACPTRLASYAHVFPAPIRFDCALSGVWFARVHLTQSVRRNEQALRNYLAHAQRYVILPHYFDRTVRAQVEQHLLYGDPAWSSLATTAAALGTATATLQRHLVGENTTFQRIKDRLRLDHATRRLTTSDASIKAIADEVGYSDVATFQRAFKRWTGLTPAAHRRQAVRSSEPSEPGRG